VGPTTLGVVGEAVCEDERHIEVACGEAGLVRGAPLDAIAADVARKSPRRTRPIAGLPVESTSATRPELRDAPSARLPNARCVVGKTSSTFDYPLQTLARSRGPVNPR
jgi:hypothetical protein